MKICVIGSYAKALVMTADRIPLLGETLIGYDYAGMEPRKDLWRSGM